MSASRCRLRSGPCRVLARVAAALSAAVILAGCSGPDIVEKKLSNLAEARESGVLKEGGWLPGFLPASAADIKLRYDVDTNEIWIRFEWNGMDMAPMEQSCHRIERSSVVFPRVAPTSWWPDELSTDPAASVEEQAFQIYRCADQGFVGVALDGKRGYYWYRPTESD